LIWRGPLNKIVIHVENVTKTTAYLETDDINAPTITTSILIILISRKEGMRFK